MKEALFKAKRIGDGKWVEGYYQKRYNKLGEVEHLIFHCESYEVWEYVEIDISTLCEYTGKNDNNGNKIWSNDIVKFDGCSNYAIFWDSDYCAFGSCYYSDFDHLSKYRNTTLEVVGNIFDNPELLEI